MHTSPKKQNNPVTFTNCISPHIMQKLPTETHAMQCNSTNCPPTRAQNCNHCSCNCSNLPHLFPTKIIHPPHPCQHWKPTQTFEHPCCCCCCHCINGRSCSIPISMGQLHQRMAIHVAVRRQDQKHCFPGYLPFLLYCEEILLTKKCVPNNFGQSLSSRASRQKPDWNPRRHLWESRESPSLPMLWVFEVWESTTRQFEGIVYDNKSDQEWSHRSFIILKSM